MAQQGTSDGASGGVMAPTYFAGTLVCHLSFHGGLSPLGLPCFPSPSLCLPFLLGEAVASLLPAPTAHPGTPSLIYTVVSARGCPPWRPDALMCTTRCS